MKRCLLVVRHSFVCYLFFSCICVCVNVFAQSDDVEVSLQRADEKARSGELTYRIRYSVFVEATEPRLRKFLRGSTEEINRRSKDRIENVDTVAHASFHDADNWRVISDKGVTESVQEGCNVVRSGSVMSIHPYEKGVEEVGLSIPHGMTPLTGHGFSMLQDKTIHYSNGQVIVSGRAGGFTARAIYKVGYYNYPLSASYSMPNTKHSRIWKYSPTTANEVYPHKVHLDVYEDDVVKQSADIEIQKVVLEKPLSQDVVMNWFSPSVGVEDVRLEKPVSYTYGELLRWNGNRKEMTLAQLLDYSRRKLRGEKAPAPRPEVSVAWGSVLWVVIPATVCFLAVIGVVILKRRNT